MHSANFVTTQWLLYFEGSSPHFGAFCVRPDKSWPVEYRHVSPSTKKDDDRRAILKNAQQALGKVMLGEEDAAAG